VVKDLDLDFVMLILCIDISENVRITKYFGAFRNHRNYRNSGDLCARNFQVNPDKKGAVRITYN
jgi:hypothetical protein